MADGAQHQTFDPDAFHQQFIGAGAKEFDPDDFHQKFTSTAAKPTDTRPEAQPGAYQTKPGAPIKNVNVPTPLERVAEITTGSRHPFHDAAVDLGEWRDKPAEKAGQLVGETARVLPNMARSILYHPIDTALNMTGGKEFAEDVDAGRGWNAVADVGAGAANVVGPVVLGGPESMASAGDAGASALSKMRDVPSSVVENTKDWLGTKFRTEPTADTVTTRGTLDKAKSFSTLKPGVKAVASIAKVVGGPEVVNAVIPEHPVKIGPFSRLSNRMRVPEPVLPGTGAPLPDASEFYEHEGAERNAILKRGVTEPEPVGLGAPLPDAGEFYENRAQDLVKRGKEQDAIDRAKTREDARVAKTRVSIAGESTAGDPRRTGSEGRPATWTNERVVELAATGNRDAIAQLTRRGLPLPENARYVMGDQDFPRSVNNPREVTRFTPEGVAIRDQANPAAQNPSSRAKIQIVGEQPSEQPVVSPQKPLNFDIAPTPGRSIPQIEQPVAAVDVGPRAIPTVDELTNRFKELGMDGIRASDHAEQTIRAAKGEAGFSSIEQRTARERIEGVMSSAPAPATEPVEIGPRAEKTPAKPLTAKEMKLRNIEERPAAAKGQKTREPREQLQNFDHDTLEAAKQELVAADDKWQIFERPGRYFSEAMEADNRLEGARELTHAQPSSRPSIEAEHPWLKKIPKMTAGKLRTALESGKGVEYNRLLNEAGKHIQSVMEANAPLIEELRGQLESTAQQIEDAPELAQTLRDLAAGKYSAMRDFASFAKEKLNEASAAAEFFKAVTDAAAAGDTENFPESASEKPAEDTRNIRQATQLGPTANPQSIVESAGAKFVGIQKNYGIRPDEVVFQTGDKGSSLHVPLKDLSVEAIRKKISEAGN